MWDGKERRQMNSTDHDLLTRIDSNLLNFLSRFNKHEERDDEKFNKHDNQIGMLQKIAYGGLAIVAFIEVVLRFLK